MFSKSFLATVFVAALSISRVQGHAAIAPVLGLGNTAPVRGDVQRPSAAAECGKTDIATALAKSTAVNADASGSFTTTITNFNGGKDGSRQVTLKVDGTATGKSFVAGTVTKNGDLAPPAAGSQQIVAALPAGTKCTGGATKDLCLASFTTAGGFGNCVVVKQAAAAAAKPAAKVAIAEPAAKAAAPAKAATATPAAKADEKKNDNKKDNKKDDKKKDHKKGDNKKDGKKAAGTRAARALLEDIEARGQDTFEVVKRGVMSWIWA